MEYALQVSEPYDRLLEEAFGYFAAALDPSSPGYTGDRFQFESFPLSPAPLDKVPLLVGGSGRNTTPRLAGTSADEFNVYPGPDQAVQIDRFRSAAIDAGRDPESIRLSSSGQVVAATTESALNDLLDENASAAGITREELDADYEKRHTPRGTYGHVREQLAKFARLGIMHFYFQGAFAPSTTGQLLQGLGIS